jgi:hypothetical protein
MGGLSDTANMFLDLYEAAGLSSEGLTDLDSVCSDVSRETGGAESLLDDEATMGWIADDEPLQRSSLSTVNQLASLSPRRLTSHLCDSIGRFGDSISPQDSLNLDVHSFGVDCMLDLVSSFSISDDTRLLPTGGDLQVVGVGMSLLSSPTDDLEVVGIGMTMFPSSPADHHRAPAGAGPACPTDDALCYLSDQAIPTDWTL